MEEIFWDFVNKFWGIVEFFEYKYVVFGFIFFKFVSDKFVECRE